MRNPKTYRASAFTRLALLSPHASLPATFLAVDSFPFRAPFRATFEALFGAEAAPFKKRSSVGLLLLPHCRQAEHTEQRRNREMLYVAHTPLKSDLIMMKATILQTPAVSYDTLSIGLGDIGKIKNPIGSEALNGNLVYLTITRPDIAHAAHVLSQFLSAPISVHYSHLLWLLRYLHATTSRGLLYSSNSFLLLRAYSDATWASDPVDRCSVAGFCLFLGPSLIAWKSK